MFYLSPSDPSAIAALAFLEGVGVPLPAKIIDQTVSTPDGLTVWKESQYVWTKRDGTDEPVDVYWTALSPSMTQAVLFQNGVPGVPDPGPGKLTLRTPPSIPAPVLTPVKPVVPPPTSPIGGKRPDGNFDAVGGFNFPLGFVWKQAGVNYTLAGGVFDEHWVVS